MRSMDVKYIEIRCGSSPTTSYQSPDFLLKFVRIPIKQRGSAENFIGVIYVECLVGNNYTNNSMRLHNIYSSLVQP